MVGVEEVGKYPAVIMIDVEGKLKLRSWIRSADRGRDKGRITTASG